MSNKNRSKGFVPAEKTTGGSGSKKSIIRRRRESQETENADMGDKIPQTEENADDISVGVDENIDNSTETPCEDTQADNVSDVAAAEEAETSSEGETFDTESGQMAFIDGATSIEDEQEPQPQEEETEKPHPDQIAFVDCEEELPKKDKKAKSKEKKPAEKKPMIKEKKRRGFAYHCCMALVIFNFVCTFAILVVGWIMGDQYCRRQLGLSLGETFGVFRGLTRSSDAMVDNAYTEEDEQNFYDKLGGALLLKDGALDGDEFKQKLAEGLGGDGSDEEGVSLGDVMLDYFTDKVLIKSNFDADKINDIDLENPVSEDTMLTIDDTELGAFLNGLVSNTLGGMIKNELTSSDMADYGIDVEQLEFEEYIKVDQIKFFEKEYDGANVDMMRATASVNFSEAISDAKSALDMDKFVDKISDGTSLGPLGGILKSFKGLVFGLVKSILPSRLYLTVDIGLSQSVEPTVYVNNMSEGKMENFYTLLDKVGLDLKGELNKLFVEEDGGVKSVIDDINEAIDLEKAISPGKLECDIYDIIIGLTELNYETNENGDKVEKPADRQVTSADLLGAMKLILSDSSSFVNDFKNKKYSYKSYKINSDGTLEFDAKTYDVVTGAELDKLIDVYEREILKSFADGYGLKTSLDDENGADLNDLIDTFKSEDVTDALMELFDSEKIKKIINGEANGVKLTDRMLAALFMRILKSDANGDGEGMSADDMEVEFVFIEKRKSGGKDHYMLNAAVSVKLDALITGEENENDPIGKLVKNLFSDKFIIGIGMDITSGISDNEIIPTEIKVNDLSAKVLDKFVKALGVLSDENGDALSLGEYLDLNVLSDVHSILDGFAELPGVSYSESTSSTDSALNLPDIFNAIAGFIKEDSDGDLTDEDIRNALKLVVGDGPFTTGEYAVFGTGKYTEQITDSEKAVIEAFKQKYGISNSFNGREYDLGQLLAILGIGSKSKAGLTSEDENVDFYSMIDALKLETNAFDQSEDWRNKLAVELVNKPLIDDLDGLDMFTAVIRSVVFNSDGIDLSVLGENFVKEDILYAKLTREGNKQFLTIAIRTDIADILPEDGENDPTRNFIISLLPDDSDALIELKVDVTEGSTSFADVIVLNCDEAKTGSLLKMLRSCGLNIKQDLTDACQSIREAYVDFQKQIAIEYDATSSAVKLPNIFSLIGTLVLDKSDISDEDIKAALKGIYSTSETVVDGKSRLAIFEESVKQNSVEASANYENFMREMRIKYYLRGAAAAATTFDDLYDIVSVNGFDIDNINISGDDKSKSLAYDKTPFGELRPLINLGDLGAIMDEKIENDDYEIYSVDIRRDSNGNAQLVLYIKLELNSLFEGSDGENNKMNDLIKVTSIFAETTATISDDAQGAYDCTIVINSMYGSEGDALFDIIGAASGRTSAEARADLDKIQNDVGSAIFEAIDTLKTSLGGVEFVSDGEMNEKGISLNDVFSFLKTDICETPNNSSPEEIRNALQGLYQYDASIANPNNYKRTDVLRNEITSTLSASDYTQLLSKVNSGTTITDKEFGTAVAYMATESAAEIGKICQFNILAGGGKGSNRKADIDIMSKLGYALDDSSTYVLMTMTVKKETIMGGNAQANLLSLIPDDMLITFILEYKSTGFVLSDYTINNMSKAARNALVDLIGVDQNADSGKTVGKQAKDSMDIINSLLDKFAGGSSKKHTFTDDTSNTGTSRGGYKVS